MKCREQMDRESQPDGGGDRQPERKERGKRGAFIDPHAYDAAKKITGKKRHILVDTQGLMLQALVHAANIQDRDGGAMLMATLFGLYPFLLKLYADGGYQGPEFRKALAGIVARSMWKSSNVRMRSRASWCCPNDG